MVKELGRVPLDGEVRLKAKKDKSFPSHSVFSRFGGKAKLLAALREHSKDRPEILSLLPSSTVKAGTDGTVSKSRKFDVGYVYLMKSGRHFKIGRSNSVGRREWELGIKIPIPPSTIHSIETDDPPGVEAYWHRRFAGKRGEGEWFNLTADDIAAFKRWKRIA